jgi:hypothetical protein
MIQQRQSKIANRLTLPLLVFGILAQYSHHAAAANHLALAANFFYRCSNFHVRS